jgi:hypothetical protein
MKRGVVCLCAVLLGALLTATSIQSASKRPRFFVTISGTQHYEWTLEYAEEGCSFKGHGEQSERFGTSRPVKVIPPPLVSSGGSIEFQALRQGGWGRTVPLAGRETRSYQVLRAPVGCPDEIERQYRSDCRGTNPLLPRAGVVLVRLKQQVSLRVPVDTPWINRKPSICNILLFDIRNFYEAAVGGLLVWKPIRGGSFENRRAKTLRWSVTDTYCASGGPYSLVFRRRCGKTGLTGGITTTWTITFGRTR